MNLPPNWPDCKEKTVFEEIGELMEKESIFDIWDHGYMPVSAFALDIVLKGT